MISLVNYFGNNIQNLGQINSKKNTNPSFKGISPLQKDTVNLSSRVHKVTIKDMNDNDVEAKIIEIPSELEKSYSNEKKFELYVNDKNLGYATVRDNFDKEKLQLLYLYTEENKNRHYKGAGTELLKCAVNESIKRGYGGKIIVQASHSSASPLAFYYKNNFLIKRPDDTLLYGFINRDNASIQYAIENNIPINNVFSSNHRDAFMNLDEEGAKALLEGKRLYKERFFQKIAEKEINGNKFSANFVKSNNENEYFIQIANEDASEYKSTFTITLQEKENKEGKKYFEIQDMYAYESGDTEDMDFALEILEKIEQEKGYEKYVISENINKETKRFIKNMISSK